MKGLIGKILLASLLLLPLFSVCAYAQLDAATMAKRQARKNLVIREWNTDAKTQTKWLDRITTYDDQGRKIVYNEKNKPSAIRKYEYNPDGTKKKQYNYAPNGKLQTVKVFEYTIQE